MYPETRPGQFYLIDTECVNGGIPYGENFYVVNRYCISRVSSTKCRLRITSQIKYRKSVWGIVKNFIEKNAAAGIVESFNVLGRKVHFITGHLLTDN
jgi:VAD1 Analog of StAR-related lipid transfer domain